MQAKKYKFVLLGDTDSGKTSIARRFCESDKPKETRSVNPNSKSIKTSYKSEGNFDWNKVQHTAYTIWRHVTGPIEILEIAGFLKDSAAQEVKRYQADRIIIVVDSTDGAFVAKSFQDWLRIAIENTPPDAPIYIWLSKNDENDECTELRKKITSAIRSTQQNLTCLIGACSAQENTGIAVSFDQIFQEVKLSSKQPDQKKPATEINFSQQKKYEISSTQFQKTNNATTGWSDFFFKNYPNWLIGLIVLSLLIEFANLGLQIVSFFPQGQFLGLGLSFDYAAPTMHAVLWIGISLITWGGCALLKKTLAPSSESTLADNPLHRDSTSLQTSTPNPQAAPYKPLVNPVPTQDISAGKQTEENIKAPEEFCTLF